MDRVKSYDMNKIMYSTYRVGEKLMTYYNR